MKALVALSMMLLCLGAGHCEENEEWWQTMSLYQIYPRSFKDSDGDGVGDLRGIASKLDHLSESNIDAFWLSPIYPSPMVDFGYDISDFINIDSTYGTMEDFENLAKAAHEHGLKIIVDFVPNHSSDKHAWFQKSLNMLEPYTDYYIWRKGKVLANGTRVPPNNWVSVFGGPAWTWREERQAYYLHQFAPEQPDLNFDNENIVREMKDVMRFWLRKGVDGFRIDAVPHLCEDNRFLDEPLSGDNHDPNNYGYTQKIYTKDQPLTYEIVRGWRETLDEFTQPGRERIMMIEAYANISMTMKYYDSGAHFPFNFGFITSVDKRSSAADFRRMIDTWMENMPPRTTANWVAGNHDKPRLVTRFGPKRAEAVTVMTLLLPGASVTYYGEEIGMIDTWISWEDTKDPQGCNAGKEGFEQSSRDPARTPFQWDDTTSAGFSLSSETWLPVNENYRQLNLAEEKKRDDSYYALYLKVSALRKSIPIREGQLITELLNDNVLGLVRETENDGSVYVIINFADHEENVDLSGFRRPLNDLTLYCSSTGSDKMVGSTIEDAKHFKVPPQATLIYTNSKIAI